MEDWRRFGRERVNAKRRELIHPKRRTIPREHQDRPLPLRPGHVQPPAPPLPHFTAATRGNSGLTTQTVWLCASFSRSRIEFVFAVLLGRRIPSMTSMRTPKRRSCFCCCCYWPTDVPVNVRRKPSTPANCDAVILQFLEGVPYARPQRWIVKKMKVVRNSWKSPRSSRLPAAQSWRNWRSKQVSKWYIVEKKITAFHLIFFPPRRKRIGTSACLIGLGLQFQYGLPFGPHGCHTAHDSSSFLVFHRIIWPQLQGLS